MSANCAIAWNGRPFSRKVKLIRPSHLGICPGNPRDANADAANGTASDSVTYTLTVPSELLSLDALTNRILAITLERCNGNKSKASQMLRIGRKAFYRA